VNVSNFIDNSAGNERGAGASKNFTGDRMAKKSMRAEAGVIESQLGIIETTNIDSLNQNSNKGLIKQLYTYSDIYIQS